MPRFFFHFFFVVFLVSGAAHAQVITTIAGTGVRGGSPSGTPATAAMLYDPVSLTVDKYFNVYVPEVEANVIHKIDTNGIMTTIVGTGVRGYSGDGALATDCSLISPRQVAIDKRGRVFFTEAGAYSIRYIDDSGLLQTIIGQADTGFNGDGLAASLTKIGMPASLCFDTLGQLYFNDGINDRIRMIDTSGIVHTVAGYGVRGFGLDGELATNSKIVPGPVYINPVSNEVYFSEESRIRKITASGILHTVVGDTVGDCNENEMPASSAKLNSIGFFSIDDTGQVYFGSNNKVCVLRNDGIVHVLAGFCLSGYNGDHILASTASLYDPNGVSIDSRGRVFIAELFNWRIRCIGCSNILGVENMHDQLGLGFNVYPNPVTGCSVQISVSGAEKQWWAIAYSISSNNAYYTLKKNQTIPLP